MSPSEDFHKPHSKERKYRRYDLHLPVHVSFPFGRAVRELKTVSKNVSVGGLLLRASEQIPLGTQVSITINVLARARPIRLFAEGEVVRVEALERNREFALAVECKRPIADIVAHLPVAS